MRDRSRLVLALIPVSAAMAPANAGDSSVASSLPPTVEVRVSVTDLRSSKGVVRACMTPLPGHFPKCRGDAAAYRKVLAAADETLEFSFTGVRPGRYAIALLHDENGNGKADRVLGMMPREGFGFSRDAPVRMAPPKFEDAAFEVAAGPVSQTIRMRYMM